MSEKESGWTWNFMNMSRKQKILYSLIITAVFWVSSILFTLFIYYPFIQDFNFSVNQWYMAFYSGEYQAWAMFNSPLIYWIVTGIYFGLNFIILYAMLELVDSLR